MPKARLAVIAVAIVAVLVAIGSTRGGGSGTATSGSAATGSGAAPPAPPAGAVRISFVFSPEKEALLTPLVRAFNASGAKVGGKAVVVEARNVSSGEAQAKIATQQLKPVAWTPSSSLWGRLLTYQADQPWVPEDNPSLVRTPLVIAMWEPLARALGWPKKSVSYAQILKLATSKRGWADYGRPEYGAFKLGHTNPDFSTSGLSAVAAEYFAATGKREGLTVADVASAPVRTRIKAIEQSIIHYGDTTLFFADQMRRNGPAYASAVAMEEATLVDYNTRRGSQGKLVGLYPREGTFFSDNPYIVLNAPWVTPEQKQGAKAFGDFLAERLTPAVTSKAGFRPGDPAQQALAPVDAEHGADLAEPRRVLSPPQPEVLARVKSAWRADRKAANVLLVVDTSGSMSEEGKLEQAKAGLQGFFSQLSPRDRVGLTTFNSTVTPVLGVKAFGVQGPELKRRVADLLPEGETAWIDATGEAVRSVLALNDPSRINAVVILTDGEDTKSRGSVRALQAALDEQSRTEGLTVRVYTIAYGQEANATELAKISEASGGKAFVGDPKEIASVYASISSFF